MRIWLTWRQLAAIFGEHQARALLGLTNVLVMFGGSKDGAFNQEISDLVGPVRVAPRSWQTGAMAGRTFSADDIAIRLPEEIRRLKERQALILAENGKPGARDRCSRRSAPPRQSSAQQ